MKAFLAAQAFVQIIGIAVLHDDGPGVKVILPTVEQPTNAHTAILVFRRADRVDDGKSWPSEELQAVSGYSFIRLNGEQIRLKVFGFNRRSTIPDELPHLANCPSLRPGYQPPSYESAAAVVSIPRGRLRACRASAPGVVNRVDTRVTLNNYWRNYRVIAAGTSKSLTLRNGSTLMIANAPTAWIEGPEGTTLRHVSHANAYASMAAERSAQCSVGAVGTVTGCDVAFALAQASGSHVVRFPTQTLKHFETYECSNTQWP